MGVFIRLERRRCMMHQNKDLSNDLLPAYDLIVRGKHGIRGGFLENIGSCRLFGAYKILYIKKERLFYWLENGAICSKRVLKELIKNGVNRA